MDSQWTNTNLVSKKRMRRVLFVGPTGVGKSTLVNILINNSTTAEAMSRPASASDTACGQTAAFITYYSFPNYAYTDSIGLGDNRFEPEDVMKMLKSILKSSSVGYNKVYFCIQYGRISADIRRYIDLITTLFGESVLEWCSIIFTRCSDQTMNKNKYLTINSQDANLIDLVNQVKTVVFGDNMIDQDPEMEVICQRRRQGFLDRIKKDIDETSNKEYFKILPENLFERIQQILRLLFSPLKKVSTLASEITAIAVAATALIIPLQYQNYFGECPICTEDMTDINQPVMTQCNHVYHKVCLTKWVDGKTDKDCPLCRTKFDDSRKKFYTVLTGDE